MSETVIHTTAEKLVSELLPIAGSRRVEVRILDATREEERALLRRAIDDADDEVASLSEEEVFNGLYKMLEEKHGIKK